MILAPLIAAAATLADIPRDRVGIAVTLRVTKTDGRDGGSVWGMTPSLEIGKQTTFQIGRSASHCGGSVRFGESPDSDATTAWRIEVTPLKVAEMDTVTFRLAWSRTIVDGRPASGEPQLLDLTLHAGQSVPIDVQPWAVDAKRSCGVNQAVLTVSLQPPPAEMDRQLVLTDLWLLDTVGGAVQSQQHMTLRGRYGDAQSFFFDDITVAERALDFFGEIVVIARGDGLDLQITTTRRRTAVDGKSSDHASVTSTLHLRPSDTAAIELPKSAGFEGHELSLRIKSREIRPAIGAQPPRN